jgi:hypothetical protein
MDRMPGMRTRVNARLVEPELARRLAGLTRLFDALIPMLAQRNAVAAAAPTVGAPATRVMSL